MVARDKLQWDHTRPPSLPRQAEILLKSIDRLIAAELIY